MTQQPTLSANRVDVQARGDHARPELALADAHAALTDCGITMSPGRVRKLLKGYRRCRGRTSAATSPTSYRAITYRDNTGETAVRRVMRGGS